jgi:hypothetical protein
MEDQFKRLENKLDYLSEAQVDMSITLASQHETLKEHMRRTELLEEHIQPIREQHYMIAGALKLIGLFATVAGAVSAIYSFLK